MSAEELSARLIDDAVIYPTIRVASRPGQLLMGVYDGNDTYVEGSALDRRSGERGAPVPPALFPHLSESEAPEAIYAGTLYFHFGHFLLESLARAWYAQQHPEIPFVWAGSHDWQQYRLRPWQLEILDLLKIRNPRTIVADPIRFKRLHIPDIGYRYDDRFHPRHAEFMGSYQGPAQVPGARLWLSRRKIGSDVRDLNAASTERRLERAGWTISHPYGLTVRQQLDQICRAETVAGEEGSAFHSLMLLRDISAKQFQVFRRSGPEHGNMQTIGLARGVNQHFHTLDRELVLRAEGRAVSKVSPNSSEVLDVMGVSVPAAEGAAPRRATEAALERVLARFGPERFLDVGTMNPHLLLSSTATTRVAVSAEFGFDPRTYADSGVAFYELRLDRYAQWFAAQDGPFDVIRIAGPNYGEFINSFRTSKKLAHRGTVWILGSGDRGARVALAIRLTHPGFTVKRLLVRRKIVYLAQRVPGEPISEREAGRLPLAEVNGGSVRPSSARYFRRAAASSLRHRGVTPWPGHKWSRRRARLCQSDPMRLLRVDPEDTSAVAASVKIFAAARLADDPEDPPHDAAVDALRLRYGWDLEPAQRFLLLPDNDTDGTEDPGAAVGVIEANVPQRDNRHLVEAEFVIHPDHRRRGHGSAALVAFERWAAALGRSTIWLYPAADDPAGCSFAERHGYTLASQDVRRIQRLDDAVRVKLDQLELIARPAAADYRFERLQAPVPDSVLSELVDVTAAINDAPMGDLESEDLVFDLHRLQDVETAAIGKGARLYRVVARRMAAGGRDRGVDGEVDRGVDGEIGGHTVVLVQPRQPSYGVQDDTAVARDHRGHRLGLLLKIEMLRWLAEAEPQLEQIETWNNVDNTFMINVNEALGYRLSRVFSAYQHVLR